MSAHGQNNPYVCGKCGSKSLYREDDYMNNQAYICCKTCGNRYPGGMEPRVPVVKKVAARPFVGADKALCGRESAEVFEKKSPSLAAKMREYLAPEATPAPGPIPEIVVDNKANDDPIIKGEGTEEYIKKEAVTMKGKCANCKREINIKKSGMCSVCCNAAEGKNGPEREQALVEIRGRIERGELQHGRPAGRTRKAAAPAAENAIPPVETQMESGIISGWGVLK